MNAFTFAGFNFPRSIVQVFPRKASGQGRVQCVYYHAPKPILGGEHPGRGFYLEEYGGGANGLRWQWADEVEGASIRHAGWFCDEFQDSKIRGIIARLPHGRGFLAGWSMGEQMASTLDGAIYSDATSAAYAADSMAERAAEDEREYQEREQARIDAEEREIEANERD